MNVHLVSEETRTHLFLSFSIPLSLSLSLSLSLADSGLGFWEAMEFKLEGHSKEEGEFNIDLLQPPFHSAMFQNIFF